MRVCVCVCVLTFPHLEQVSMMCVCVCARASVCVCVLTAPHLEVADLAEVDNLQGTLQQDNNAGSIVITHIRLPQTMCCSYIRCAAAMQRWHPVMSCCHLASLRSLHG